MKKLLSTGIILMAAALALTGCGGSTSSEAEAPASSTAPASSAAEPAAEESSEAEAEAEAAGSDFDATYPITVITRESGSGTRGAFIELFGIEVKDDAGNKVDQTTMEAVNANSTNVVMTQVAGDEYAIGYISLGSVNDTVKPVKIEGVEATAENVSNGTYQASRPFNIATKGEPTGVAQDFINYIMSAEGQQVVEDNGYVKAAPEAAAFESTNPTGSIVVAGSSSVSPVMEKLIEAYTALNTGATIELQTSDSTAGMTAAIDGTCDIGMASRALKEEEAAQLNGMVIANDGIAVVVAPANPAEDLTSEQVRQIFTGEVTTWEEVLG